MSIRAVDLYHYRAPLIQSLVLVNQQQSHNLPVREGLLLHWQTEHGEHWSEIAPLPLFSQETLEEATEQCRLWFSEQDNYWEDIGPADAAGLFPSVDWGIGSGLAQAFSPIVTASSAPINNCWMPWDQLSVLSSADTYTVILQDHAGVIKVKPPMGSADEVAQACISVIESLPQGIRLRLDLNQRWPLAEAVRFAQRLTSKLGDSGMARIDFIEEPLMQAEDYPLFWQQTGMRFALDESLRGQNPLEFELFEGIAALIIKPMLTGYQSTHHWLELGQRVQAPIVLSSALDAPISVGMYCDLADHYQLASPQGLDTAQWLGELELSEPESLT